MHANRVLVLRIPYFTVAFDIPPITTENSRSPDSPPGWRSVGPCGRACGCVCTGVPACGARSIEVHGEQHSDCAHAYFEYARALLHKVQAEGDPFGSAGPKPEAKTAAGDGAAGSSGPAESAPDSSTVDGDGGEEGNEGEEGEEGGEEGGGEEGGGEEEADDLELAFQCFEARPA